MKIMKNVLFRLPSGLSLSLSIKTAAAFIAALSLFYAPVCVRAEQLTHITAETFYSHCNDYVCGIRISSSVTEIDRDSFRNFHQLVFITVDEENPNFSSYSNCLYNKDRTELLCFPQGLRGANIPKTVVSYSRDSLYGVEPALKEQVEKVIDEQGGKSEY